MAFLDACRPRHNLAWRAKAALEAIAVDESLLDGMKLFALCETFDCRDFLAFNSGRQRQTGNNAVAIDPDGARPTSSVVAAFLRAGQFEMIAKHVEKSHARLDLHASGLTIDFERDGKFAVFCEWSGRRVGDIAWLNGPNK